MRTCSNFGVYATPERQLTFDINDFDETFPGPWEWDVKRLAASVAVVGLVGGFPRKKQGRQHSRQRPPTGRQIRRLAPMRQPRGLVLPPRHGRPARADPQAGRTATEQQVDANLAKARFRDSTDALRKLCVTVDGQVQITNDPPLIMPGEELLPACGVAGEAWYARSAP